MSLPVIGVSMGDPAGIGPEILVKVAADTRLWTMCRLLAIGDYTVLEDALDVVEVDLRLLRVSESEIPGYSWKAGVLPVLDLGLLVSRLERGVIRAEYGKASYHYITTAISLAEDGVISAVVTNPINKAALAAAGVKFAGHTEIFASQTCTKDYAMMIAHDSLRAVHVSTHVSLRDACDCVKKNRVLSVIRLAADAVARLESNPEPVGVCGLNPHAGEGGLFGREEIEQILPAIQAAQEEGLSVVGPIPPDTAFSRAMGGEFSVVVAMYHDQGHIPLKLAGFKVSKESGEFESVSGVNITLGLPIIRTSVDHGTAFDLAGTGKASPQSLIEAIEYAVRLCR